MLPKFNRSSKNAGKFHFKFQWKAQWTFHWTGHNWSPAVCAPLQDGFAEGQKGLIDHLSTTAADSCWLRRIAEAAASASVKPDLGNDVGQNGKQISLGHSFNNNKHSIFTKFMTLSKNSDSSHFRTYNYLNHVKSIYPLHPIPSSLSYHTAPGWSKTPRKALLPPSHQRSHGAASQSCYLSKSIGKSIGAPMNST